MLETLEAYRELKSARHALLYPARRELGEVAISKLPMPPPIWVSRMHDADEDGIQESLHASIREEGWRAYAEGGLAAMHALFDAACGDNSRLASTLDHRWDGIGMTKRGHWAC